MIVPELGQIIPVNNHSRAKLWFKCDCGRRKLIVWKNYKTNHTKSCGLCKSDKFNNIGGIKFGKLTARLPLPAVIKKRTELIWDCECGGYKSVCAGSVVGGYTKSCGCINNAGFPHTKPILINKETWLATINQLVDIGLPDEWSRKSGIICSFRCECGLIYERRFLKWKPVSTCGRCRLVNVLDLFGQRYGKLEVCDGRNISIHSGSSQKVLCRCDCGNEKLIGLAYLTQTNGTRSCNECNIKSPSWWLAQRFGRLRVVDLSTSLKEHSEQLLKCVCSCGAVCEKPAYGLTSSNIGSCGGCYERGLIWWDNKQSPISTNTNQINNKYPLQYLLDYFGGSCLEPQAGCNNSNTYINFKCLLCGEIFKTKLTWIWHHKIVSCGCATNYTSKASNNIGKFIVSLGVGAIFGKNEHRVGPYKLDVFVPSHQFAVELNGLRYHSSKHVSDFNKYKMCVEAGINLVMIYSDEWQFKTTIFKRLIAHKLGKLLATHKLRASALKYRICAGQEATAFYEANHYQGGCGATWHIGAYHGEQLIACMSIRKPSRQLAGDFEIARMARIDETMVYGLWSKMLKVVIKLTGISGKLVSYSDNRLMSGAVYSVMGFTKVSQVRPDYYWTDGDRRRHKSSMRKPKSTESNLTETQLRTAEGFTKIYDFGKTKWELEI